MYIIEMKNVEQTFFNFKEFEVRDLYRGRRSKRNNGGQGYTSLFLYKLCSASIFMYNIFFQILNMEFKLF